MSKYEQQLRKGLENIIAHSKKVTNLLIAEIGTLPSTSQAKVCVSEIVYEDELDQWWLSKEIQDNSTSWFLISSLLEEHYGRKMIRAEPCVEELGPGQVDMFVVLTFE